MDVPIFYKAERFFPKQEKLYKVIDRDEIVSYDIGLV